MVRAKLEEKALEREGGGQKGNRNDRKKVEKEGQELEREPESHE